MRPFTDNEFLTLWECCINRHPLDRALLILSAAFQETPYETLADWPIGRRNQALSEFYCNCVGPHLRAWTICAICSEKLEFEINPQILVGGKREEDQGAAELISVNDRTFRIPNSRDLARAATETDPVVGAKRIVEGCLVEGSPPAKWSDEELSAIGEKLGLADPLAEIRLTLQCPSCGNDWHEALDLVSFSWRAIESRVQHIMYAIHTLASAYGWSEMEILSLSETRRAWYMEMARS